MAERESATFDILSLSNAGIKKCVDQRYPLLYPQITWSIAFSYKGLWDLLFPLIECSVFYQISKLDLVFVGIFQMRGVSLWAEHQDW